MSAPKLFSPGPVLVAPSVRNALLHYDICHRGHEFEEMFVETQERICRLFGADPSYNPLLVSGSGTSANEAVLSSIVKEGQSVLLIKNGVFGERLEEICNKYRIPTVEATFPWGTYPDVDRIEALIRENPAAAVVAMVFHETSTGMINPVPEVGALCRRYGRIFFVDCVSAAGGQNIDMAFNGIDIATSVAGKCVGGFPGSAFLCAKEELLESVKPEQCRNVYLSLHKHYHMAKEQHQTPNTPNVNLFWALNAALRNLDEEGLEKRIKRYRSCAAKIREGAVALGMTMLLREHLSNTVTSLFLPEGVEARAFLAGMERRDYVFYLGKGKYEAMNMIQIANMGEIYEQDCCNMLEAVECCLRSMGQSSHRG